MTLGAPNWATNSAANGGQFDVPSLIIVTTVKANATQPIAWEWYLLRFRDSLGSGLSLTIKRSETATVATRFPFQIAYDLMKNTPFMAVSLEANANCDDHLPLPYRNYTGNLLKNEHRRQIWKRRLTFDDLQACCRLQSSQRFITSEDEEDGLTPLQSEGWSTQLLQIQSMNY